MTEAKVSSGFLTKFTKVYFAAGTIGLVVLLSQSRDFAIRATTIKVGIYWLFFGLVLALFAYGVDCKGKRLSGASKFIGWILIIFYLLFVSASRHPAFQ